MKKPTMSILACALVASSVAYGDDLDDSIKNDYESHLAALFEHFHRNPELSLIEDATAERMASELRDSGFEGTEGVGGTGVVAIMRNGDGPVVMMRADMDGLPVEENSGLAYASVARQVDPITGNSVPVMHACGHDVHITSLVGTARHMSAQKEQWSGTLMLLVQPAEEPGLGARLMREDNLWERFGTPEYALAFHVSAQLEAGKVDVQEGSPYAGSDLVDIIIHGVGAHGASPHASKDPIVLGSQIVMALQTLVARELSPREPGVVTVGSFHAGTKHNIISDQARLQLTVRSTSEETRKLLLDGIERIAENMGRVAGLPEDMLPEVIISEESVPPTVNDAPLARRLRSAWIERMGAENVVDQPARGMVAQDFPFFSTDPDITSVFWAIGGTPKEDFDREAQGGPPVPTEHSPQFKISQEPAIRAGVESTITALMTLMGK